MKPWLHIPLYVFLAALFGGFTFFACSTGDDDDSGGGGDAGDYGACCEASDCSVTTYDDCSGEWQGPDTNCNPNPCQGGDDDDDDTDDDDDNDDDDDDNDDDNDDNDDDDTNYWLYFDGAGDYIDLGVGNWLDGTSYTIEAWLKPLDPPGADPSVMVLGSANWGPDANWFMAIGSADGSIHGGHWDGSENWVYGSSHLFGVSDPVHAAISYDVSSDIARIFINGDLEGEATIIGGPGHYGNISISFGAKISNDTGVIDSFYKGYIDEVRISNIARYTMSFVPSERFEPDVYTVGLWHFDEGSGIAVFDESPNGHLGIIHNAEFEVRAD